MRKFIFFLVVMAIAKLSIAQTSEYKDGRITIYQDIRLEKLEANSNKLRKSNINKQTTNSNRQVKSRSSKSGYTNGYRIQIYSGRDRNKANDIRMKFINSYPGTSCYLQFLNPNYKIRVGDYSSSSEANKQLKYFQRAYPGAYLIPTKVKVR